MAAAHSRQGWFPTTHWSLILRVVDGTDEGAVSAMERLCELYWKPVYVYVRRSGKDEHDASDLTQEFFLKLLKQNTVAAANPDRGRFRNFLLTVLRNFLANEHVKAGRLKRGGSLSFVPVASGIEAEEKFVQLSHNLTPQAAYEHRWALTVLEHALERLAKYYAERGEGELHAQLKSYLWGERGGRSYAEAGRELKMSEEAVKKAVQRMKQRFRRCLRETIADTMASLDEVDEELSHLLDILRKGAGAAL